MDREVRNVGTNVRAGRRVFSAQECMRLVTLYAVIALLHLCGWGLFLHYAPHHPALVGLGFAAYLFGLRHAFDADHIAAVDDSLRYMLQKGNRPLGVGFFFALGHSTIVLVLAVAIICAAPTVKAVLPALHNLGGIIGAGVSGIFLWTIGMLNLSVLIGILKASRKAGAADRGHDHLQRLLAQRGFINRLVGGRLQSAINHSWQMFPVGVLFGLGFDTASEVGLLAITAGAATGDMPVAAMLSLPILFAAGMTAMDTTDGVLMLKAYDWAFVNPRRKLFYNIGITGLSVAVALFIGTIELLQVLAGMLDFKGRFFDFVSGLDFGILGYLVVGAFLVAWGISVAAWRFGRTDNRSVLSRSGSSGGART